MAAFFGDQNAGAARGRRAGQGVRRLGAELLERLEPEDRMILEGYAGK